MSALMMSVTCLVPSFGNAYVSSVLDHWAACLELVQVGRRISMTISDALEKVGVGGRCRASFLSLFRDGILPFADHRDVGPFEVIMAPF